MFCDTNFIFGILDLHEHPFVEVSNELVDAITKHSLPIKLRCHESTLSEFSGTIEHYGDILKKNKWATTISRAATNTNSISGIEQKYHQKNAETNIDVEDFFKPYKHVEEILRDRKLEIYRSENRLSERAKLEADYNAFLKRINKPKIHKLIEHDVKVLDCVQSLKSKATSNLDSGALFVTCDFLLYRFDSELIRKEKVSPSVVLPNVLWQVLRPFFPYSNDFDKSFAEAFAITELRTIGSGASKACSKMLGILNSYKEITEDVAVRIISNDMLLTKLSEIENDEKFREEVDLAIEADYQNLIEEVALITKQKQQTYKELEEQKNISKLGAAKVKQAIQSEKETKEKSETLIKRLADWEKKSLIQNKRDGILFSILFNLIFYLIVQYVWPWDWFLNHPNRFPLQINIHIIASCAILGGVVEPWRKNFWSVAVIGTIVLACIQLLGGSTNGS